MTRSGVFETDDGDTQKALMKATYRALCTHGYAGLTIARIGEEFEKSASLLYHHYDGKDDLLVDFLETMLDRFESEGPRGDHDGAVEALEAVLDRFLGPTPDDQHREFTSAMVELRAQAPHNEAYREHFTRHDRFFTERLSTIIREGVEEGVFRDVDPDRTAALLHTTFNGAMLQRATTDAGADERIAEARAALEDVLAATLYAGDD